MILEELYPLISDGEKVLVKDAYGDIVAEYDGKNSIPETLNKVEVENIAVGITGWLLITLKTPVTRLVNIKWDPDEEDVDLPDDVCLLGCEWNGGYDDELADELSDMYGYCVESFSIYNH